MKKTILVKTKLYMFISQNQQRDHPTHTTQPPSTPSIPDSIHIIAGKKGPRVGKNLAWNHKLPPKMNFSCKNFWSPKITKSFFYYKFLLCQCCTRVFWGHTGTYIYYIIFIIIYLYLYLLVLKWNWGDPTGCRPCLKTFGIYSIHVGLRCFSLPGLI